MPSHDAASPRQLLRKAWGATTRPFGMIRGHRPRAAAQREAVTCLRAYQRTGDPGYRDLAISLFEGLCAGERDDDIAFAAAADLATLRFQRYLDDGGTELLESAVAAHEDVVRRCPPGHPLRAAMLGNLASALVELNSRNPGARVLDRAVELHQSAVRMTPPDAAWRPALLVNLATAMVARYQRDGDPADLDDAAACHEELRRFGAADETVALSRADLQWERYCRSGAPGELEDVISALKEAVPRLAAGSPSWYTATADLANAMLEQESRTGARGGALELIAPLAANTPENMPAQVRARVRRAHALAVWREYQRTGDLALLGNAIDSWQAALDALPGIDADRLTAMNGLSVGLAQRAGHTRDMAEADRAAALARDALAACPEGTADRAVLWNTLGRALLARYQIGASADDLNEAVGALRACLADTPRGAAVWPSHAASVATALRERAAAGGSPEPETDLAEAVRLHRAAAAALDGALEQPGQLVNLGMSLHGMAVHQPDVAAYLEALATFRSAVELARVTSPPQALDAALAWHRLAVDTEPDWDEAAAAADAAVAALRVLVAAQLPRSDKETWLRTSTGVAAAAARAHCAAGRLPEAVAAMEAGRGLLLSEALPADDRLRVRQPDLYDRYAQAAALFAGRSTLGGLLPGGGQPLAVISRGSVCRGAQDHPAIIHSER